MCVHTDFMSEIIFDYGTPQERKGTEKERRELIEEINEEFEKEGGYWHYLHNVCLCCFSFLNFILFIYFLVLIFAVIDKIVK